MSRFLFGDQRPEPGVGFACGLPTAIASTFGHERVQEVSFDPAVNDDPLHRDADLAGVDETAGCHGAGCQFEIGVRAG